MKNLTYLILFWSAAVAAPDFSKAPEPFKELHAAHREDLKAIDSRMVELQKQQCDRYVKDLEKLFGDAQEAGNLDAVILIKKEIARFADGKTPDEIRSKLKSSSKVIQGVTSRHDQFLDSLEQHLAKHKNNALKTFLVKVADLKKRLVQDNELEQAMAVDKLEKQLKQQVADVPAQPQPQPPVGTPPGQVHHGSLAKAMDIGKLREKGISTQAGGIWTIKAGGSDIWGNKDEFRYVYGEIEGNCELIVQVLGIENTDSWAKAGLMFRENTSPGSAHVAAWVTPGQGVSIQNRPEQDKSCVFKSKKGPKAPRWLRLVRNGEEFTAYHSGDGRNWEKIYSYKLKMNNRVTVGLAVTAHNPGKVTTGRFSNFRIIRTAQAPR